MGFELSRPSQGWNLDLGHLLVLLLCVRYDIFVLGLFCMMQRYPRSSGQSPSPSSFLIQLHDRRFSSSFATILSASKCRIRKPHVYCHHTASRLVPYKIHDDGARFLAGSQLSDSSRESSSTDETDTQLFNAVLRQARIRMYSKRGKHKHGRDKRARNGHTSNENTRTVQERRADIERNHDSSPNSLLSKDKTENKKLAFEHLL